MSAKHRLLVPLGIVVSIASGSIAIASFKSYYNLSSSTIAQQHDRMNHGTMMSHSMDIGPANANYDLRFIDSMVPHHQGALVMAQEVITKSKRPELVKFAKGIIKEQKKEISQMQQWRKQWYPKVSATPIMWHGAMNHEMSMTDEHKQSMMMMSMSLGKADDLFDLRFLDAMIPHHQGAVTMAKDALQKSTRAPLIKLSQNILTSQQAEIDRMNQWRKKWYGKN